MAGDEKGQRELCEKLCYAYSHEVEAREQSRIAAVSGRPWKVIAMDFIIEFPESGESTVIWTVVGLFSKQAHFTACSSLPLAQKLAKMFLQRIYRLHGVPKHIISDHGIHSLAKF